MAGTIYGLGLAQQLDSNGDVLGGCLLYIYDANTSTPTTIYEDFALGTEATNPLVANANGRIPAFWLANGSYRVRLTDSDGNEIFDEANITAIGASSGTSSGSSVDSEKLYATGDTVCTLSSGIRTGFVRLNGRTIGGSSSGATERANADTEDLFRYLWDNVGDTYATVSGGRGASAAADFAANKRIVLPSMQGRVFAGLDDMGGAAASVLSGKTTVAEPDGAETATLAEANLPSHTHGPGSLTVTSHAHSAGSYAVGSHTHGAGSYIHSAHTHIYNSPKSVFITTTPGIIAMCEYNFENKNTYAPSDNTISGTCGATQPTFSGSSGSAAPAVDSGATGATGSGTAVTITQPYRVGTWYIKL